MGEWRGRGTGRKGRREGCGQSVLHGRRIKKRKKDSSVSAVWAGQTARSDGNHGETLRIRSQWVWAQSRAFTEDFLLLTSPQRPWSLPLLTSSVMHLLCTMDTARVYFGLKPPRTPGAWHESPPSLPPGQSLYFSL